MIAEVVKTQAHDLMVMGAYSHSRLRQFFLGSKTSELLKSAGFATLLLR